MSFFGSLIAVLLALYLTGNVQEGSILYGLFVHGIVRDALLVLAFALLGGGVFIIARFTYVHGKGPRALWNDFKSGKLKF